MHKGRYFTFLKKRIKQLCANALGKGPNASLFKDAAAEKVQKKVQKKVYFPAGCRSLST